MSMATYWRPLAAVAIGLLWTSTHATLIWAPCAGNFSFDCTTLTIPLEYASPNNGQVAHVPLARYNATVPARERRGTLLTNPGGPGSSGIDFLLAGAGEGISTITEGHYDIISWDPRGVGSARPLLQCYTTIGEEERGAADQPLAAEIEYTQFTNASYMPEYYAALEEYDSAVGDLARECAEYNSSALYTSSAAYVVRDMAAIVDALDGEHGKLNYWGLSYGTIYGAEFIQTFPERVGKIVFDGVFDAEANAEPYTSQLPHDELYVRDTINDFASMCTDAGPDACALSTSSSNATMNITARLANLQSSLFGNPVPAPDGTWSITAGIFSFFMYSYLKLPPSWPTVASAVHALETGDAEPFATLLTGATTTSITNESAPSTGSMAGWPIQCTDNAPSNQTSLHEVARLVLGISLAEETPWLNADLSTLSFCRNFPNTRPLLPNLGARKLENEETDTILAARNSSVLIVNPLHDPTTPVSSAQRLHEWLSTSSQLVTRRGPGHTTISLGSLGLVQAIREYFVNGTVPSTPEVHDISQIVFPGGGDAAESVNPDPVFNGTFTEKERELLEATYVVFKAFMGLP
ncbi:Alpha/Beta hydrolase protein [Aspergillus pseudoustus]|uniref:Alpha/Beta hydrolase protein n=1 Tax=Aspergillus pseudoustus TaxID=1810923 RepID=A0ABR4JJ16_9EURO